MSPRSSLTQNVEPSRTVSTRLLCTRARAGRNAGRVFPDTDEREAILHAAYRASRGVDRTQPRTAGDELQEVESGRDPATPAWMLLSVIVAVGALFAVALALVALAYLLA